MVAHGRGSEPLQSGWIAAKFGWWIDDADLHGQTF
jgi:hypothetical protein